MAELAARVRTELWPAKWEPSPGQAGAALAATRAAATWAAATWAATTSATTWAAVAACLQSLNSSCSTVPLVTTTA